MASNLLVDEVPVYCLTYAAEALPHVEKWHRFSFSYIYKNGRINFKYPHDNLDVFPSGV